jgi:hypothetical protein
MKQIKYIFSIMLIGGLLVTAASCFQDLNQDPPFNYPDGHDGPENVGPYGEGLYMPFETADFKDNISENTATVVGTPTVVSGKIGQAYKGDVNTYLTYSRGLLPVTINKEFSAAFWYKMGTATRAGILTCGKDNTDHSERKFGFRFFREGSATAQRFKLNIGNGTAEVYADGGVAADLNPAVGWVFLTFTIAEGRCAVYFNGVLIKETAFTGAISWDGCGDISIGSGAPTFTVWNHLSDTDLIDELRFFNKALTVAEITTLMNAQ